MSNLHVSMRAATALLTIGVLLSADASSGQEAAPGPDRAIRTALDPFVARHELAGAVALVADRERTLSVTTVGFADVGRGVPMRPDALFWIASQTKPITAAALMILADEGKLRLDDAVEKYLPEFHDLWVTVEEDTSHRLLRRPGHPITIREILCHTSGLPFVSPIERPTLDLLPLRVAALGYAATPLLFEPGTRYQYSNAGINTAGRIIEVVSGMPYERFLETRLLEPLGMHETTFRPEGPLLSRLAKSYRPGKQGRGLEEAPISQLHDPLSDPVRQPMPAGGLFSTARDLEQFCRMMLNRGVLDGRRVLSESAWTELTQRQTPAGLKEDYGLGFARSGGGFGHGGAHATNMWIEPERGRVYIYLVQHSGFPGEGGRGFEAFMATASGKSGKP